MERICDDEKDRDDGYIVVREESATDAVSYILRKAVHYETAPAKQLTRT